MLRQLILLLNACYSAPPRTRTALALLSLAMLLLYCASSQPVIHDENADRAFSPPATQDENTDRTYLSVIRAEEKANGVLLIIPADKKYSNIHCWYEDSGTFSITLYPSSALPAYGQNPFSSNIITEYIPILLPESAQLSFKIRYKVISWNVYQDDNTHEIVLSLFLNKSAGSTSP